MTYSGPYNSSDLPIFGNKVYHLDLSPDELAEDIIIVGDPERVPFIADVLHISPEVDRSHRGLRTITGRAPETGKRLSITTSGMGTPSLEIVLNELVALHEIDFSSMKRKEAYGPLKIIRIGTSGGVQQDTELGTLIVTDYAVGLDNTGLFYSPNAYDNTCRSIEEKVKEIVETVIAPDSRFKGKIHPYVSRSDPHLSSSMEKEGRRIGAACKKGITVSSSGFFANQGRDISRVGVTLPDIDWHLASLVSGIPGLRVENMEMEASFLLHFIGGLGYSAGAICAVIDNRKEDRFDEHYTDHIKSAARIALSALHSSNIT